MGTLVEILGSHRLSNGQTLIVVEGVECFEVDEWLEDDPYPRALVGQRCCDDVAIEGGTAQVDRVRGAGVTSPAERDLR